MRIQARKLGLTLAVLFLFVQIPLWAGFPLTLTDDTGTRVTVTRKPVRIVSLTLMTDEMLLNMVSPERLAAVTTLSVDPTYSNEVAKAGRVKVKASLAVEGVLALRPDLVLVASWSDPGKVAQLREARVPVFLVNTPLDFAGVKRVLTTLGTLVGEEAAAARMVTDMDRRLAALEAKLASIPTAQRPTIVDYNSWGTASGAGSSWDTLVKAAGLRNAVGGMAPDQWGQVPLSKEVLVQLDPTFLALPSFIFGEADGGAGFRASVAGDPSLAGLQAVRNKRLLVLPEGLKSSTSQYMVDAAEALARAAWPDLFR